MCNVAVWTLFLLFLFYHYLTYGRGLKRQSEASSNTAGYVMDIPNVDREAYN